MVQSLALDALLAIILISVIPLGMYRGGVREVCTSAGLLLGILVAQQWAGMWGNWLGDITGIDRDVARFITAMTVIVLITALIGYGAAASFSHRPDPGGRMFGGLLGLLNAVVFLGVMIQYVADDLYEGVYPRIIREGSLSRALSLGFDWVLLAVTGAVTLGILFGMIVRERDLPEEEILVPSVAPAAVAPTRARVATQPVAHSVAEAPEQSVPEPAPAEQASPIRVKEVRHWEEPVPSTLEELQSGWTRTWPTTVTSSNTTTPRRSGRGQRSDSLRKPAAGDQDVVRDWLRTDKKSTSDE